MRRFDDASSSCITMKFNKFSQKIIHPGRGKRYKIGVFLSKKKFRKILFYLRLERRVPVIGNGP